MTNHLFDQHAHTKTVDLIEAVNSGYGITEALGQMTNDELKAARQLVDETCRVLWNESARQPRKNP